MYFRLTKWRKNDIFSDSNSEHVIEVDQYTDRSLHKVTQFSWLDV